MSARLSVGIPLTFDHGRLTRALAVPQKQEIITPFDLEKVRSNGTQAALKAQIKQQVEDYRQSTNKLDRIKAMDHNALLNYANSLPATVARQKP